MKHITMAKNGFLLLKWLSFIIFLNINIVWAATDEDRKVYIVYMGALPEGQYLPTSHHQNMLQQVVDGSSVEDVLVRSYKRSFNGFAAKLSDTERKKLASMEEVASVFPSGTLQLHTTRSWDFMGLDESISRKRSVESDIIVGVLDTGIWPESESFSDEGFGPAPKKWKGACEGGKNFTCNNKIIGARYYGRGHDSARDKEGHGTHTASTAAGNEVKGANFFGLGQGTARGGVPSARIAAYKVCSQAECNDENILAAFDDAIADGVDIITISIGRARAVEFSRDSVAIGGFHAMANGILTSNSAGNNGPYAGLISSVSPWLMSVAASTTDRLFVDKVVLGNGKTIVGYSLNPFTLKGKFPLIYDKGHSSTCAPLYAKLCIPSCLNGSLVKGKIVLCDTFPGFSTAREVGAVGSILQENQRQRYKISFPVSLPASALNPDNYNRIIHYINTTKKPEAEILKTNGIKDSDAPVVSSFSSRGPSVILPDILKPDITAPGVDILAAWSPLGSVSRDYLDDRRVKYNIVSGTSMSCPHAAGVAAYVKSFHPDWSPSAIKSAIMTTAWPMNSSKNTEAEFAYGSGHINPVKAIYPGLVYEAYKQDYIQMLCSMGYDAKRLRIISGDNSTCLQGSHKTSPKDLNYPSMAAQVSPGKSFTLTFPRTVTNVGVKNSTYRAKILENPKVSIKVVPRILSFRSLNEKKSFNVTVTGKGLPKGITVSAALVWSDGNHGVRSPIVVNTVKPSSRT